MALYVIVNGDGTRQRVANVPLEPQSGQNLVVFSSLDEEPSETTHVWNVETHTYDERPVDTFEPVLRSRLSKREFRARLGADCRRAINARLRTPPTTPQEVEIFDALQDLKDELLSVDFVDVLHPTTVAAVGFLQLIGYLTAEQADAALALSTVSEE